MLVNPGRSIYTANQQGQTLPIGKPEKDVMSGELLLSLRTADHQRVLAVHLNNGSSLLISKSLAPTGKVLKRLGTVLLIVGGIGVAIAAIAGGMVARAGLRPVARLTEAAERVARTDDLRPIPVFGSDELARLTEAFNMMLRALAESRERQARLVTDAGHELRTPLTSLRTNVELLMASMAPGAPRLPERGDGRAARRRHRADRGIVNAGRRSGGPHPRRGRRRRPRAGRHVRGRRPLPRAGSPAPQRHRVRRQCDLPWQVYGDAAGLARAVLNLLDNAAKWSPPDGRVGVRLTQIDPVHAELVVSDHGPGIPPQERQLVFERFFRSTSARAMPGSGLGLAIVKQVVLKHGGALRVEDTVPGGQPPGTSMHVVLPGRPISRDTARGGRNTTGDQRGQ